MPGSAEATVRRAGREDAEAIARIHTASRAATMPYLPPQRRSLDEVERWAAEMTVACRAWVAVREAEVLGYACLDGSTLEHLYLRPDVRRQGVGTLLLGEVKVAAADTGLTLHVFEQNVEAQTFYERQGFRIVSRSDGRANMEKLPDLTMVWSGALRDTTSHH
jgi:ribosomal protein S18 acetylase RimI-like enzyme